MRKEGKMNTMPPSKANDKIREIVRKHRKIICARVIDSCGVSLDPKQLDRDIRRACEEAQEIAAETLRQQVYRNLDELQKCAIIIADLRRQLDEASVAYRKGYQDGHEYCRKYEE